MERPQPPWHLSRRRVSAPATTSICPSPPEASIKPLFFHPSVRIVSFTAQVNVFSLDLESARQEAGTLPSGSQTERTIAVGSLRIYRAPGSVAFLSCGAALQPILPKSQCWCINEDNSTYVLQVRRPTFWRIELPSSPSQLQTLALDLKGVLNQVLQFEKTYCPFQRTFSVELPEQSEAPAKKKPWTPKHLPGVARSPVAELHGCENDIHSSDSHTQSRHDKYTDSVRQFAEAKTVDGHESTDSATRGDKAVQLVTASSKKHPEMIFSGQATDPGSEYGLRNTKDRNIPLQPSVASIVDGIHDRFGHLPLPAPLGAYEPGATGQGGHADMQYPSPQMRRHSFDCVRKPSLQVSEDKAFLRPMSHYFDSGVEPRRSPLSRSGSSPHVSQSTKSTGSVEGFFQHPRKPHPGLSNDGSSQLLGTGSTTDPYLPPRATGLPASLRLHEEAVDTEAFGALKTSEASRRSSNTDDTAVSQANVRGIIAEAFWRSQNSKPSAIPGLRVRNVSGTRAASTSPAQPTLHEDPTPESSQKPVSRQLQDLRMNIISKACDALLLPLAYAIALILKVIARVLSFRWNEPILPNREPGDRVPEFLQYSEDELTE